MLARWPRHSRVAVASLGGPPYTISGVPVLRPLALLKQAGFKVHAVSRGPAAAPGDLEGVTVWQEPNVRRVARRVVSLRPELVFVESHGYGTVLGPLARRSWIRNPVPASRREAVGLQRALLRTYDAVSFTNPADRASWRFRSDRHADLAYPLDVEWWSASVPRRETWWTERGWAVPSGPVLVCNAAYARRKRVLELLELVAPFLRENPSTVIVFAGHQFGEPDIAARLEALPGELGVTQQVRITGWMSADDVRDLLAWASAAIINSIWETQCLAVYEALAAGVPTLISDIPVLTSQFPSLPAHADGQQLRANLERVLGDEGVQRNLLESTREQVAWADLHRHDAVFADTMGRLGLL